jgi:hypothetical protein
VSRLNSVVQLPVEYDKAVLSRIFSAIDQQVNGVSEGSIQRLHNATTAVPSTGTYQVGDFVRNTAPSELGGGGSKYVLLGWVCVLAGTPGTWKEFRGLTGN